MRIEFHPEFPKDVLKFRLSYSHISAGLAERFRHELDQAVKAIKSSPTSAGHFLNLGSVVVPQLRRKNLKVFPFFILYGLTNDAIIFGAVVPSKSDPLTWLTRFKSK